MPEIQPSLPSPAEPAGPALSLPVSAMPEGLKAGESLVARVLAQVSAQRYAIAIGGREILADSTQALSPGDQLRLVVRQTGTKVLMDLVPMVRGADAVARGETAPAGAVLPSNQAESSGGAPRAGSPGSVQSELRNALAGGAPLGELLAESARLLAAEAGAGGAGAAAGSLREIAERIGSMLSGPAIGEAVEGVGGRLAAAFAALPAQVAELMAAVELRLSEALRTLPAAVALGALAELLESLPAGAVGTGSTQSAVAAFDQQRLLPLVDRLLQALQPSGGPEPQLPQLPAELRQALGALTDRELSALKQLVAERERAVLASSPQVAALSGAHRALASVQDRLDAARLWSVSASTPSQSFSYVELPLSGASAAGTAGLRVLVRKSADDGAGGGGGGGRGRGTVRAVLNLDMSALGQVWSELTLTGRDLAVRLELPDRERSAFVTARLDELTGRLSARGLEASVAAVVARPRQKHDVEPGSGGADEAGGLNLWA